MTTDTMIRQLRYTDKKHENDKLHTFDTNISLMCTEVADRLEEIEKEKSEIRNKAIEEFAERLKNKLVLRYGNATPTEQYVAMQVTDWCNEIAESMKGEKE